MIFLHSRSSICLMCMTVLLALLAGCSQPGLAPTPLPTPTLPPGQWGYSDDEIATLRSLEKIDDYPLYTLRYQGGYDQYIGVSGSLQPDAAGLPAPGFSQTRWGCSLFAALGDPARRLYGRNFDWNFSPALVLFTDPPDGYASAAMVDIAYLGFSGETAKDLTALPPDRLRALLYTPALPFDGMNEKGLAVGMAAVPPGDMLPDPGKQTLDELEVIRQILDHAATVDEALAIIAMYNIDMGQVPIHYLVSSAKGDSALVEFYQGEMAVMRNTDAWQFATNFLVSAANGQTAGLCPRYDRISRRLEETGGRLDAQASLDLLSDVSQGTLRDSTYTQWSVVYDMSGGDIRIVMGMEYSAAHSLHLDMAGQ